MVDQLYFYVQLLLNRNLSNLKLKPSVYRSG